MAQTKIKELPFSVYNRTLKIMDNIMWIPIIMLFYYGFKQNQIKSFYYTLILILIKINQIAYHLKYQNYKSFFDNLDKQNKNKNKNKNGK